MATGLVQGLTRIVVGAYECVIAGRHTPQDFCSAHCEMSYRTF